MTNDEAQMTNRDGCFVRQSPFRHSDFVIRASAMEMRQPRHARAGGGQKATPSAPETRCLGLLRLRPDPVHKRPPRLEVAFHPPIENRHYRPVNLAVKATRLFGLRSAQCRHFYASGARPGSSSPQNIRLVRQTPLNPHAQSGRFKGAKAATAVGTATAPTRRPDERSSSQRPLD
jgi:hypothetical protein